MTAKHVKAAQNEQILGEIETRIVGMQYHNDANLNPGERVNLDREPENSHDNQALRVENGRFQAVGHRELFRKLPQLIRKGAFYVKNARK